LAGSNDPGGAVCSELAGFDVELGDNWVRDLDAKASKRLLALLKRHHTYGTGEMVLPRKGLP
jgi:hypothetical protein